MPHVQSVVGPRSDFPLHKSAVRTKVPRCFIIASVDSGKWGRWTRKPIVHRSVSDIFDSWNDNN